MFYMISMIDGKTIDDLNINSLFERLDGVKEVIIATNPTREGETTALFLAKLLAKKGIETSRIANGLPIGSNIDYEVFSCLNRKISYNNEERGEKYYDRKVYYIRRTRR